jgi:hypothetical protein
MKCLLCNKRIPKNRWKYCSDKCNKRSYYLRQNPNCKSSFNKNPEFWKTETGIGFKWERWGSKLIGAKHLEFGKGADLDWNGKQVDVKSSNLYKRKFRRGEPVKSEQKGYWVFNRNKKKPIDYFLCICLLNNKPFKVLLIPDNKFPASGLVIGWKSQYDIFKLSRAGYDF